MFDKIIITLWTDNTTFNMYLISIDDSGTLFLTERKPEVVK